MTWSVEYTRTAERDLRGILDYISIELAEPVTARRLARLIIGEIAKLSEMPERFRLTEEEPWRSMRLRQFAVKNYLVFYMPVEARRTVYIVRIFYGGRDIRRQLEGIELP